MPPLDEDQAVASLPVEDGPPPPQQEEESVAKQLTYYNRAKLQPGLQKSELGEHPHCPPYHLLCSILALTLVLLTPLLHSPYQLCSPSCVWIRCLPSCQCGLLGGEHCHYGGRKCHCAIGYH